MAEVHDGGAVHTVLEVCGLMALAMASLCVSRVWIGNGTMRKGQ